MSTKNIIFTTIAIAFVIFIVWVGGAKKVPTTTTSAPAIETEQTTKPETNSTKAVTIAVVTTNKGVITLELYTKEAPKTVANFIKLANEGFYNTTRFHRVIKGFMIQGGDPYSKDVSKKDLWGQGGPGYTIADENTLDPGLYKVGYKRGILAMARTSQPNSAGSQFFIMHQDYPLPPDYTIFGRVTSGLNVVDTIANVETTGKGVTDRPVEDVTVEKIEIK